MRWQSLASLFGVLAGVLALGCVIETGDGKADPPDPCDDIECSINGHCVEGECTCNPGFLGDPWAARGCQPPGPESPCGTTCGLNAYCDGYACVCEDGFVACGTGDCVAADRLCDGVADCPAGGDEDETRCTPGVSQTWTVTDGCDDGRDVEFRLWAEQRAWAWPGPDQVFRTVGFGYDVSQAIECIEGELVCFGGRAGDLVYGVDLDAEATCADCCFPCDGAPVDFGVLQCDAA